MKIEEPRPVQFFIGALFSDAQLLDDAIQLCANTFSAIDYRSQDFLFDSTHYYDGEMGTPIYRTFISFNQLMSPGDLAQMKVACNNIESQLAGEGARKVNLDVGYLDFHKLVLASAKYNGQKIYLDLGIYADITLLYEGGEFLTVPNTFPDFKSTEYHEVFGRIRNDYKTKLKRS